VLAGLLVSRADVQTTILRTPGMSYQDQGNNKISNLFNYKVINKTNKVIPIQFRLESMQGEIQLVGTNMDVKEQGILEGAMFIHIDRSNLSEIKTELSIGVYSNGEKIGTVKTNFMGPESN
jgi:hypothetical protein